MNLLGVGYIALRMQVRQSARPTDLASSSVQRSAAIFAVWAGALSNHQAQHRLAAAVIMTLVILVIVGGGVYFGRRGLKKPSTKRQP